MIHLFFRTLRRILIFVLGAGALSFIVASLWPKSNSRVAIFFALLATYCLMAYVVIPALMRLSHKLSRPNHIPLYVVTGDGWPADPVNIAIVARNEKQFIKAMRRAGWYPADKATLKNMAHEAYSILFNQPYPTAPFSNLYLFNRPFDIGFQKPSNKQMSARSRHHVRFWRLEPPEDPKAHHHLHFWHTHLGHMLGLDKQVWIGAAIDDTGPIALRWRYGQITHKNNPDTNVERDLIISDLEDAGQIHTNETIRAGEPFTFRGQTLGNKFFCDGTIKVIGVKSPLIAGLSKPRKSKKA